MSFASVDIGNTALKVTIWTNCDIDNKETLYARSVDEAIDLLKDKKVECVGFCSTRILSEAEYKGVRDAGWWELKKGVRLPIAIDYATPDTLGTDRLAAAVGAKAQYPGMAVMVADAGTALTLDIVDEKGVFQGGNISPGLEMRLRSLHEFTSRLPKVEWREDKMMFGRDTESAILDGAHWGLVAEISRLYEVAKQKLGCRRLILTGGDAPKIKDSLARLLNDKKELISDPDLVARGLYEAYKYENGR